MAASRALRSGARHAHTHAHSKDAQRLVNAWKHSWSNGHAVHVNGIDTDVLAYHADPAKQLHLPASAGGGRVAFLIIPGNPGHPGFYKDYMRSVFDQSGQAMDVICIGHAGHSRKAHNKGRLFNLYEQGTVHIDYHMRAAYSMIGLQICVTRWTPSSPRSTELAMHLLSVQHKIDFVRMLIDAEPSIRFFIMGHSVGSHISLEILKALPEQNFLRSFLFFPTIMRIGSTPNAAKLRLLFRPTAQRAAACTAYLLSWLPSCFTRCIVRRAVSTRPHVVEAAEGLLDYHVCRNALWMASHEMREILDLEAHDAAFKSHLPRLLLYFGATDDWCPLEFYDEIKQAYPKAQLHVCQEGLEHAFVIEGSGPMAHKTWKWMRDALQSQGCKLR